MCRRVPYQGAAPEDCRSPGATPKQTPKSCNKDGSQNAVGSLMALQSIRAQEHLPHVRDGGRFGWVSVGCSESCKVETALLHLPQPL